MDDLISRQAAIDAVRAYATIWMEYTDDMTPDEIARKALTNAKATMIQICEELPSAQPEQQWIPCSDCERRCEKWESSKTLQG